MNMSNDVLLHSEWMDQFVQGLIESGQPRPQAERFYNEYASDATKYYLDGISVSDAITAELLP